MKFHMKKSAGEDHELLDAVIAHHDLSNGTYSRCQATADCSQGSLKLAGKATLNIIAASATSYKPGALRHALPQQEHLHKQRSTDCFPSTCSISTCFCQPASQVLQEGLILLKQLAGISLQLWPMQLLWPFLGVQLLLCCIDELLQSSRHCMCHSDISQVACRDPAALA